jgi:hypothetical protein
MKIRLLLLAALCATTVGGVDTAGQNSVRQQIGGSSLGSGTVE